MKISEYSIFVLNQVILVFYGQDALFDNIDRLL